MSYLFLYLAAINIIAFAAMGIDKAKALSLIHISEPTRP